MGYGLMGVKSHMEQNGINALKQVASEQERDKALEKQLDQAERAAKTNAVVAGAGMGYMAAVKAGGTVGGPMGAAIGAVVGLLASSIF